MSAAVVDKPKDIPFFDDISKSIYQAQIDDLNVHIENCNKLFKATLGKLLLTAIPAISSLVLVHYKKIAVTKLFVIANIFAAAIAVSFISEFVSKRRAIVERITNLADQINCPPELATEEQKVVQDDEYSQQTLSTKLTEEQMKLFNLYCYNAYEMIDTVIIDKRVIFEPGRVSLFLSRPYKLRVVDSKIEEYETALKKLRDDVRPWRKLYFEVIQSDDLEKIDQVALHVLARACNKNNLLNSYAGNADRIKGILYQFSGIPWGIKIMPIFGSSLPEYQNADQFKQFLEKTYDVRILSAS